MDVFDLRQRLVDDYADFTRSFVNIRDRRISPHVDEELSAGSWLPRRPGLDEIARAEARGRDVRAAFVAMTRARDRLDVVVAGSPATELDAASWAFSRY